MSNQSYYAQERGGPDHLPLYWSTPRDASFASQCEQMLSKLKALYADESRFKYRAEEYAERERRYDAEEIKRFEDVYEEGKRRLTAGEQTGFEGLCESICQSYRLRLKQRADSWRY
jgi:hypothetical protein